MLSAGWLQKSVKPSIYKYAENSEIFTDFTDALTDHGKPGKLRKTGCRAERPRPAAGGWEDLFMLLVCRMRM
jgi:hypothetical protein